MALGTVDRQHAFGRNALPICHRCAAVLQQRLQERWPSSCQALAAHCDDGAPDKSMMQQSYMQSAVGLTLTSRIA